MKDSENTIRLRYGRDEVDIPLGSGRWMGARVPRHEPGVRHPRGLLRSSLKHPIASPPLKEIARGLRDAAILVSGRDRITRSDVFVSVLADELNAGGIPDDRITVYLATGTHQKQSESDKRALLGEAGFGRFECVQHDPWDDGNLVDLGATSFGTPIRINKAVFESDVKILTGRIAHHYFAGFSGGRKAIAPGVAAFETILANHKRVMRPDGGGRDPEVYPGSLVKNPVHLDMLEIARAASPSFCLNTVLNIPNEITHVFAGDYVRAHERGCQVVDSLYRVELSERADVVVASCGGWPYDITFMQVIKTIVAAENAVKDGGVMVLLGRCERGLEPGFLEWFVYESLAEMNRAVLDDYNLKGHNSFWIREIQSRIKIVMVSALAEREIRAMGFIPASGPEEAMDIASGLSEPHPSVLAVPYGNITVFSHDRGASRDETKASATLDGSAQGRAAN